MSIQLPQVTLLALGGKDVESMGRAMVYSCQGITFGRCVLVAPYRPTGLPAYIEHVYIAPFADTAEVPESWNREVFYNLWRYFDTTHVLFIHADGFVVNPHKWQQSWLEYDYIGAPWPLIDPFYTNPVTGERVRVGNSVGLRSRKLCMLPTQLQLPWERVDVTPTYAGNYHEDNMLSIRWKHIFEQHGCRYPSIGIAAEFSRETELPENQHVTEPFCFHKYMGRNSQYPHF